MRGTGATRNMAGKHGLKGYMQVGTTWDLEVLPFIPICNNSNVMKSQTIK